MYLRPVTGRFTRKKPIAMLIHVTSSIIRFKVALGLSTPWTLRYYLIQRNVMSRNRKAAQQEQTKEANIRAYPAFNTIQRTDCFLGIAKIVHLDECWAAIQQRVGYQRRDLMYR